MHGNIEPGMYYLGNSSRGILFLSYCLKRYESSPGIKTMCVLLDVCISGFYSTFWIF